MFVAPVPLPAAASFISKAVLARVPPAVVHRLRLKSTDLGSATAGSTAVLKRKTVDVIVESATPLETSSLTWGLVVPIPTFPLLSILIFSVIVLVLVLVENRRAPVSAPSVTFVAIASTVADVNRFPPESLLPKVMPEKLFTVAELLFSMMLPIPFTTVDVELISNLGPLVLAPDTVWRILRGADVPIPTLPVEAITIRVSGTLDPVANTISPAAPVVVRG